MKYWNSFIDLDADEEQLECPFVYASAKNGYAILELDDSPRQHDSTVRDDSGLYSCTGR